MKNAYRFTALIAVTLGWLFAATASATEGVSPGETDRIAVVEVRCPTFSWDGDPEAVRNEIVAYALPEEGSAAQVELTAEAEVLYAQVSGGATSWTPSADQCFAPGGHYVWFVRPVMELAADQVIEAGEWSAGRYFAVPAAPSEEEMRRAVEVLKRWEAANGGGSLMLSAATATATATATAAATATDSGSGEGHRKSVLTASAAIRGEHPATSGEVYGLVGTSASAGGAGVATANLDGGPDLVLDGSADGAADTWLDQAGLDRRSAASETFTFRNSGPGVMRLHVAGDLSASRVTGDELAVPYGTVVSDEGDWLGAGDTIPCLGCVTWGDIADGEISASKLSAQGGGSGQVLKVNAGLVEWADDEDGGLSLPFSAWGSASGPLFEIKNTQGTGYGIRAESRETSAILGETASSAGAVFGRNTAVLSGGIGVVGSTLSSSGTGVYGVCDVGAPAATGVHGKSVDGKGVWGESTNGTAVVGESQWGNGVLGSAEHTGNGVRGEFELNWGVLGSDHSGMSGFGHGPDTGLDVGSGTGHGIHAFSTGSGIGGAAIYAEALNLAGGIAIRADNDSTDATIVGGNAGTGDLLKLFNVGDLRLRVDNDGDLSIDGTYFSGGADFAELLPAFSDDLEPGDVLAVAADGRLMKSQRAYQASVVGVYSTKPGILGGSGVDGDPSGKVPLAVVGVVPVKTCDENGPVRPGDMLVASSIPGHAMQAGDRAPNGRVIGKALTGLDGGRGEITMLVILQ